MSSRPQPQHTLEVVRVPIDDVTPHPRNARRGDVDAIAESMDENGIFAPIVVQRSTGHIIDGNHRHAAMRQLGETTAPVVYVDVDDEQATRILLAANRTNDLATYDDAALVELLKDLPDLAGTGYNDEDLTDLLDSLAGLDAADLEGEASPTNAPDDKASSAGALVDRFGVPPFTVFDTRAGYWQERRRAWTDLGIQSELGRDGGLVMGAPQTLYSNWYAIKNAAEAETGHRMSDAEILASKWTAHLTMYKEGKSTTSIFDPALCEILYRWHTAEGDHILDPWAGGSVRGIVAGSLGRHYFGAELRPEQVDANRAQVDLVHAAHTTEDKVDPVWAPGDSTATLTAQTGEDFDFIIGCPPYYDLEVYSDDPADLSNMSHAEFDAAMHRNIAAAAARLRPDRFAAVVVGSVRDKKGHVLDMKKLMIESFAAAGMPMVNDAILLNVAGTAAVRAARSFQATRTLARIHQEVLVFVKGDRKKAAARLGELDISASIAAAGAEDEED